MNTALIRTLLGVVLLALPFTAFAQDPTRTFSAEAGAQLDLDLETGGDLTIIGWDRDEIEVQFTRRGRDAERIAVDYRERSGGLTIRTEYEGRRRNTSGSADFEIRVPQRFDVRLSTMGGTVRISGVEGDFRGRTMGGEIHLTQLTGEVDLTTMGGDIIVTESAVDGTVKTMGGEVLIEDVDGNLRGSTMGGEVTYRNVDAAASRSGRAEEVRINTMGGDINVSDAPAGADVETMGGDIRIRDAQGHVRAETMGGDIDVDRLDGWIEAQTMGGDIEVRMVGDAATGDRHVELVSMGGDIELTVPADLSMTLDLELHYTRDARERYRIRSDFDVSLRESAEWEYWEGEERKTIEGTGSIGSGKHRVRIRTTNGNITLRRGQ